VGILFSATQADSQSPALGKVFSTQILAASVHPAIQLSAQLLLVNSGKDGPVTEVR